MKNTILFLLTLMLLKTSIFSELKLATWNLYNLRDGIDDENLTYKRTPYDYKILKRIINEINADIYAFQEVENLKVLGNVIDLTKYECTGSDDLIIKQQVYTCWRKNIQMIYKKVHTGLQIKNTYRPALETKLFYDNKVLKLFNIHLKSGKGDFEKSTRKKQSKELAKVIDNDQNLIIIGDFNENVNEKTYLFKQLKKSADLVIVNANMEPNCWEYEDYFIDFFVLNRKIKFSNFQQHHYKEDDGLFDGKPLREYGISDHCPLSVQITPN